MTEPVKTESVAVPEEKISQDHKHALDVVILNRKLKVAEAEKALAANEASENAYKLFLFQLYSAYNMSVEKDAIDENGYIKRNAVQPKEKA